MDVYTDGAYSSARNLGGVGLVFVKDSDYLIKEIANEYKQDIPLILYIALCNYKVEITD